VNRHGLAVVALVWAPWGCTVTAVSTGEDRRPNNSCVRDSECDQGSCREGLCQSLNGELEALLITATPPSDSGVPHLTFVTHLDEVSSTTDTQAVTLPGPSLVTGSLLLPKGESCYPDFISDDPKRPYFKADDGKSLPVTVTLALSQRLLGLPQQLYFANASARNEQGGYTFNVQVPGGEYDVYLVPPPRQGRCAVPPQLYRKFPIDQQNALIPFQLSGISRLPLSIRWPKTGPTLTGWSVDIIEPVGGNPISTEVTLSDPTDLGDYAADLAYSTVVLPAPTAADPPSGSDGDLLRLRPPTDLIAPTIFLDRSGLGLLSVPKDAVVVDKFTHLPTAVSVAGRMVRKDDRSPVPGFVTLVSTEIYGVDNGIFASYQTTVEVAADGALQVQLPPGSYHVQAVPPLPGALPPAAGPLAALETTWKIPADVPQQFGKLLELEASTQVIGQSQIPGAEVQAVPSPQAMSPFKDAFGALNFVPRATTALAEDSGRFVVQADPGIFDFTVQAPEALGFGWFVRPRVQVKSDGKQDLGQMVLPPPSLLVGTAGISLAGTVVPLASAALRAYAYLDKDAAYTRDPRQAASVVEVAETRADEQGAFRLLLPSTIEAPK
jgi:hypothetical protein